ARALLISRASCTSGCVSRPRPGCADSNGPCGTWVTTISRSDCGRTWPILSAVCLVRHHQPWSARLRSPASCIESRAGAPGAGRRAMKLLSPAAARQVEAEHYGPGEYDDFKRWTSYWHQIHTIRRCRPRTVLEVGVGSGVLTW